MTPFHCEGGFHIKKTTPTLSLLICLLVTSMSCVSLPASATVNSPQTLSRGTLYVGGSGPNNYTSIQDAVNNASTGGTVYVYSGTYYENVLITTSITLTGESASTTIIDADNSGNVVKVSGTNAVVSQFTLTKGGIGAYLVSAQSASITDTIITDNWEGIGLKSCTSCSILGNTIVGNGFEGINPVQTTDTTISQNIIKNNLQGISMTETTASVITHNTFRGNSRGVEIRESSTGNSIYHNNFYASDQDNGYDACTNTWDNGYPSGGNYWDDYTGHDNNHDGIGDTPYSVAGGSNKDHYPFMDPVSSPPAKPSVPDPQDGATAVPVSLTLSVYVFDPDDDAMQVSFYNADTQQLIGTATNVPSASRAQVSWNGLSPNTLYHWYTNASDGNHSNQSDTWRFTTGGPNQPPTKPTISGQTRGKPGTEYSYIIVATDPEGSTLSYLVDWGDGSQSNWTDPLASGQELHLNHTWATKATFTVQAKARDSQGAESDWGSLKVKIPYPSTPPLRHLWLWLLQQLQKILSLIPHR
jgi:parallel beta-helix repeat protein